MGNRILIWKTITKGNEWDIFSQTNYENFYQYLVNHFVGSYPNWGNKLWFQGLYSEINDGNNEITFRSNETYDEINNNFDLIIYPMANFFSTTFAGGMKALAKDFSNIKIPVYIIACGAQANSYDELDWLIDKIGDDSKEFISAIYKTGGEFALRGEFTKAFFTQLGFPSAVVTGCPSIFQLGRNFKMEHKKVDFDSFNPIFNGKPKYIVEAIERFDKSIFFDQDNFAPQLFNPDFYNNNSFKSAFAYYQNYGIDTARLLATNKTRLIADMNDWYSYIKNNHFTYSFGSRIHGSIMAILAGTPATVIAIDTRTQEMAEYLDIPYIKNCENKRYTAEDVYDFYCKADYTKFNATFKNKFEKYENFLKDHKIISQINDKNIFFDPAKSSTDFEKHIKNSDKFVGFYKNIKRNKPLFNLIRVIK